jgi:hypothetical protein
MKLTEYSHNRLLDTARRWDVPRDFADPMLNYLVYGYEPGSCFTAVLANDFFKAMASSHPSNTVEAFKNLTGWINEHFPREAYGSYEDVHHWVAIGPEFRRRELERCHLIYTEQQEIMLTLKGEITHEPVLY